jgi:hypothetical protein
MLKRRIFLTLLAGALLAVAFDGVRAQTPHRAAESPERAAESGEPQAEQPGVEAAPCGIPCFVERSKEAQAKAFAGSWEGVLTPEEGGPPPFRIQFTFGADGTVVQSDGGPPNPHNATPGHGAWERTGNYEFTVTYKQLLFDAVGNLETLFKGKVRFKLDPTKMEISGPVKVELSDAQGNVFLKGDGTVKCSKIRVEPLD